MSPERQLLEQIRKSDKRRAYARTHPILCAVATGAVAGGIMVIATPGILTQSSLGILPIPLRLIWTALYTTGGAAVLYAVTLHATHTMRSLRIEAVGLCLLSGCFLVYSVAVISKRGWEPGALAASVFFALFVGSAVRVWTIVSDRRAPWSRRRQ